jgi:hypothetical protein
MQKTINITLVVDPRFSTTGSNFDVEGLAVELLSSDENTVTDETPGAQPPDNTGCSPPFRQTYPTDEPW